MALSVVAQRLFQAKWNVTGIRRPFVGGLRFFVCGIFLVGQLDDLLVGLVDRFLPGIANDLLDTFADQRLIAELVEIEAGGQIE